MALPLRTATILQHLGYTTREFDVIRSKGVVSVVWRIPDPGVTEQQIIDAELPAMQSKAITAIKVEANRRILAGMPDWKQRNLIARSVELTRRESKGTATPAEIAELDTLEAQKAAVDAVRSASDSMETEVATLTTAADCDAYIVGIQADVASAPRTVEWP